MTATTGAVPHTTAPASRIMEKNTLGMILFIASEAVFFSLLILAYIYFRNASISGPTAASSLDPLFTGIFSLFLFSSSFSIWMADRSYGRAQYRSMGIWLLATILLGMTFLAGQGFEWFTLLTSGVTVNRNLFGTTFFTLTGFHGFHVTVGLIMLAIMFWRVLRGDLRSPGSRAVTPVSLYWHFVDAVWVVIYSVIYLTLVVR
jgi:heme/copper-type cytochrome/quinol oxidase subunit 3